MNRPSAMSSARLLRLLPGGRRARLISTLLVALAMLVGNPFSVAAANPPTVQLFYVALPDDDLLTLFDADDQQGGSWPDASSPLRSVTSISIADTGTLVYFDQWEDGGYDTDLANPGANVYSSGSNPDGTQIWGDGVLTNGCPPSINNAINPCTLAAHDQLTAGQVIVLDNDVTIGAKYQVYDQFNAVAYNNNNGTSNWLNSWTEVGDDAAAATGDILITSNQLRFSVTEAADSLTRGVDLSGEYNATLRFTIGGANLETDNTDEIRVQYSTDGTTYTTLATFNGATTQTAQVLDLSGISGSNTRIRFDSVDALEATEIYTIDDVEVTWGFARSSSLIYFDGRDKVGVTSPVAMTRAVFPITPGSVMAGASEVLDTSAYGTLFIAPVGEDTPDTLTDAFEDVRWFVMAQVGGATIDVDANGDGDLVDTNDLNDFVMTQGGRKSVDGILEGGTLTVVSGSPVQVHTMAADVGDTFEFRWDALIPRAQWSDSYYSPVGTTPEIGGGNDGRGCTEVWIYNPAPPGTTNENVRDEFSAVSYGNNNGSKNWSTDWVDGLDGTSGPVGGDVRVTGNRLRIGEDTDAFINRTANLTGATGATLSYAFEDAASNNADVVSVQMNDQNPNTWVTVDTIDGDDGTGTRSINIASYIAASTSVRFVITNALEGGEFIYLDNVNIAYTGAFGGNITVNIDRPGGANPDATVVVPPLGTIDWPGTATNLLDDGFHLYSAGGEPFLPIQMVDCTKDTSGTDGRLFDWGAPLVPADQLTDEVLVGYAPGCSNESFSGICHDPDSTANGSTPDVTAENSRSVVWVTPLANTTIYVDTNGSGITCPGGAGAEQSQLNALALESYRFDDDPSTRNYVHDLFSSQSYARDDIVDGWDGTGGRTTPNAIVWTSDWTETGEATSPTGGAIQVNNTDLALRLQELAATDETGRTVQRTHNTSGNSFARLSFKLESAPALDATDRIAVDVSGDGGTNWTTLQTYVGPYTPNTWPPTTQVFNISSYIATNTSVRFRFVDPMETGDYWQIDDVHIDYVNGGDYDMTASRIKTCNGALIAVAYGQNPSLSGTNDEEAQDFGTLVLPFAEIPLLFGAVGDYVWVDEDGDGDQDAGESGIPNAKVTLTGTSTDGTVYSLTTYTDANGGYLFTDLKPSNISGYTVTVDSTTLPAGLAANPTYDENGIGTPHTTVVNLASGQQHSTADFGYNWSSPAETNTPGAGSTGAIGDRVWIDTDGDGNQDPDEVGVYNLSVQLVTAGADGLFGTGDDVVAATTTTNHNGNYIFDGLAAGAYQVRIPTPPAGYVQTGDPDQTLDHKTTSPIVLGPGDVFLDADFGYQPNAGTFGSIGDLVWLDADRGNDKDASEPGIPGVTVSLIKDLDGDGVWDIGEPIIATDITDESGIYGFTGLPITDGAGTDDYIVWVNDVNHALDELSPTYDVRDGGSQGNPVTGVRTGLEISAVTNLTSTAVTDADFAYAPAGHDLNEGLIGDTIFLDSDADGLFDPGEGVEGVTVQLFDTSTGLLVATTVTNENGQYFFGGLAADTYTVQVIATTLPAAGVGLTNTVDPDAGTANQSNVTIAAGGINLVQDFGYRDTSGSNAIGGTLWEDTDTDGTLDAGETTRFAGVTVVLYEDSNSNGVLDGGDNVVGSIMTDSNGDYSFENLPDSTYFVDITDDANVVNGYWHSLGDQSQAVDNTSKTDVFLVSVAGGQNITTIDHGYYREPAAIGNFVWHDIDADGIQDAGEPGIAGVVVTLTITWPNSGGTTTLKTTTDATGAYSFGNLLLDEDQDGVGAGEPTFSVSVASAPSGYTATLANQGGDDAVDSDLAAGVTATPVEGTTDNTYDFGYVKTGSIGNTVWFDENGDGVQDAGEAGIPNVTVELWNSGHTVLLGTRITDADGQYLFTNVTAGTYQVDVLNSSLPTGLVQTQIPAGGGDFVNHADPFTSVTVTSGGENLTADFGYNWAPSTDTDGNTGTGAIGDHVWIDTDGDGRQDPGESGISGLTVQLITAGPDGLFGTVDDVVAATTATNAAGNYIFDGLAAGAYSVRIPTPPVGYTQTGDPDHFGTTGTNDNQTTVPIVLGPGDVFLNADFGYQPNAGTFGSIGDFVWFDRDADGVQDAGELGIPGVTVSLIKDLDGDGIWDVGEPIIATDITDGGGLYLFGGLPVTDGAGTDDYLVWVNDTDNVLGGYDPTFDRDGLAAPATGVISGANIAAVSNLAPAGVTDADFGYTAEGHVAGRGLIGDTIFLDGDGDGVLDVGEGVEGVVVQLYDSTGTNLLASTTTDENGNYFFANLDVSVGGVGYRVVVAASNFSSGAVLQGLANTVDPDAGTANQSDLTLTTGSPTNLAQDFGYRPAANRGTIGNLVWTDTDADGVKDAGETGISGVTVDLYRDLNGNGRLDVGEPRVGSTTTAADGSYLFSSLPTDDNALGTAGADYIVDVSDRDSVLAGQWHSLGTAGSNDNSQADPYAASVSVGTPNNLTADFGYYRQPAAIGNFVWHDLDGDGIQDAGEPGIVGVVVTLTITWPGGGGTTTLKTSTDATGAYSFGNLLLDEDQDGVGAGEPTFSVSVATAPSGYTATLANQGGNDALDSDLATGVTATPIEGSTDNTYDFGYVKPGSIGNTVWFDENGDGIQDAGEAGIPNVTVELWNSGHTVLLGTRITDAEGQYLFTDIVPGSYQVDVLNSSLPTGLVQTQIPAGGGDFVNHADPFTTVTVTAGGENLTADFGFNWAPSTDTDGNTGTGAIGDHVWIDTDGDGRQDPGESGISGLTVQLITAGPDGIFGTVDDVVA
ncbi:MAG: SdrD B-like domain-containing protein, partial [Anaerolineae bacterium]